MSSEESRGTSRSGFLKQAAGATMVAAGAGVGAGALAEQAAAAASTAGRFSLEIDGINVGMLAGASGGDLDYDVLLDPPGSDNIQRKHLGQPKYEDFTIEVGSAMGKPMYDWIKDSLANGGSRRSGALIAQTIQNTVRRTFTDAWITSVTIPALDGTSTSKGNLTVTLSAASVSDAPPSGIPVQAAKHKAWLCSNFRFVVQGVDTTRVASIDSFTWKQSVVPDGLGSVVLDAGDLGVSFDPASLPSWQRWYDNFAVGGDASDERAGTLELVGQGGTVLDLGLENLGLYQLKADKVTGSANRVKAELYCEKVNWDIKTAK